MLDHASKFIVILISAFVIGCGGGGTSSKGTVDPTQLPGAYSSSNITVNLTNCTNSINNGDFVFDTGELVIPSFTGSNFTATVTLTKNNAGSVLQTVNTVSGTIDGSGKISGSFTAEFSVDGTVTATGDGTFTGSFSGNAITISSTGTDKVGDTCKSTATIIFSKSGETNNPGSGSTGNSAGGGLQITGSDTGAIGTSVQFAAGNYIGTTYFWNTIDTSTYTVTSLIVTEDTTSNTVTTVTFGVIYQNSDNYTYTLTCTQGSPNYGDCSGVTIDKTAKTVSLNNVFIDVDSSVVQNIASSGVTLSGTLPVQ